MKTLYTATLTTPLGPVHVICDEQSLYFMYFDNQKHVQSHMKKILKQAKLIEKKTSLHTKLEYEFADYFAGKKTTFTTPMNLQGSEFQQQVWQELKHITCGRKLTYKDIAQRIKQPRAVRAVANAIGRNPLLILIPCHRVIASSGKLSGFAAGVERKAWLLSHESDTKKMSQNE